MKHARNHYAGLWRRAGALLADLVLMLVLTLLVLFVWSTLFNETLDLKQLGSPPVLSIAGVAYFLFTVILNSRLQGTPGLKLMDCRLLDARSGQPIGLTQSLVRSLLWPLSVLPMMLGIVWMIFDRNAQMLHDKLARTVVVIEDASRLMLDELSGRP